MDVYFVLLIYLEAVNVVSLTAMGVDKHRARTNRWRIPESSLIGLAFLGGSVGILGGMFLFHHKTRKPKFTVGVPVILAFEILFFLALIHVTSI